MTPTPQAIENAARNIYTATPRNRPYEQLSLVKKNALRAQATKVLTGDLGDMALVPKEPTDAMLNAALHVTRNEPYGPADDCIGGAVYRAMIAAAEDER